VSDDVAFERVVARMAGREDWHAIIHHFNEVRSGLVGNLVYTPSSELEDAITKGMIRGIDMILRLETEYIGD
jgi:hypothetical protein